MACFVRAAISAATYVETKIFGEIVKLPETAYGQNDTIWDPAPPDAPATSRNFPAAQICPRLRLVHEGTLAPVVEFWYRPPDHDSADSGPMYACPAAGDEKNWLYARLLSKDSYYKDVGYTLLAVAISFSSLITQLQLTLQCITHHYLSDSSAVHSSAVWFAAIFLAKLVALQATSLARARRKLARDPGDLRGRADLGRGGRCVRAGCMMLFYVFDVPGVVSDVLNLTHIHKPFQPFAVFRTGGSRVWIVGWPTRSHFQVDMEFSSMANLTVSIIFDMPLYFVQFFLPHDTVSICLNIVASLFKLVYSTYEVYTLRFHRKIYHEYQTEQKILCLGVLRWQRRMRADPETIKQLRGRARTFCRDLTYHFGEPYPHEELADEELSPHPPDEAPLRDPTFAAWFARFKEERARRGDPATEHLSPHPAD